MVALPDRPGGLGLPFDAWRPCQQENIARIAAPGASTVLFEAPMGFGKAATAIALLHLQRGRGLILTHTKAL